MSTLQGRLPIIVSGSWNSLTSHILLILIMLWSSLGLTFPKQTPRRPSERRDRRRLSDDSMQEEEIETTQEPNPVVDTRSKKVASSSKKVGIRLDIDIKTLLSSSTNIRRH